MARSQQIQSNTLPSYLPCVNILIFQMYLCIHPNLSNVCIEIKYIQSIADIIVIHKLVILWDFFFMYSCSIRTWATNTHDDCVCHMKREFIKLISSHIDNYIIKWKIQYYISEPRICFSQMQVSLLYIKWTNDFKIFYNHLGYLINWLFDTFNCICRKINKGPLATYYMLTWDIELL